jgi:hypothetical protein
MKIKNDSPIGDLDVPLLRRVVKAGEVVDVSEDHARRLLDQEIWTAVDKDAKGLQVELDKAELDRPAEDAEEVTIDDAAV